MNRPLDGVRVLDLTAALSGPVATVTLGDMGADVIKVETPEGDSIRGMIPMRNPGMGAMFLHVNRSKRSIVLDLKTADGKAAFLRLAARCDVFVSNTRKKALERLGFGYADLVKINPSIIYVNIVGYGSGGPMSDKPAYDDLIQGAAGIPSLGATKDPESAKYAPIAIADRVTGMQAATAVLGALYHRSKTGEGQHVEVPMFESIAGLVLSDHMAGLTFDPAVGPPVFQRYASIRRPFPTQDGFICLMVLTDRQWKVFFTVVGRPEVMTDRRFAEMEARSQHYVELYAIVAEVLAARTTQEWMALLEAADIPVAQVETMDSLVANPHLKAVGFFEVVEHPTEGPIRSMTKTSTWSATQPGMTRHTPRLGENSEEILREAGFTNEEVAAMLASGATKGCK